ncbi:MAG: GNAT family N-acetyltransferase [Gaiellaceae bacterium]
MIEPPTRRTPRLLLRAPEPADIDPLFAIEGNPEAMKHTICSPSREATVAHIHSYSARFAEDGFAPWTAVLASEERVVGWGGLNKDPGEPHWGVEVAYYIDPAYWGRGLATELVRESLALAFDDLGLDHVGAFSKPENVASVRVLVKNGFEWVRFVDELERDEYRISDEHWRLLEATLLPYGSSVCPQAEKGGAVALFGKKNKQSTADSDKVKLTDPAILRSTGVLVRARILEIESKSIVGENVVDPAYDCTLRLEVLIDYDAPYVVKVQQRLSRSILGLLSGDYIVAPAWVDPKDLSLVAVDVAAGQIEHAPAD